MGSAFRIAKYLWVSFSPSVLNCFWFGSSIPSVRCRLPLFITSILLASFPHQFKLMNFRWCFSDIQFLFFSILLSILVDFKNAFLCMVLIRWELFQVYQLQLVLLLPPCSKLIFRSLEKFKYLSTFCSFFILFFWSAKISKIYQTTAFHSLNNSRSGLLVSIRFLRFLRHINHCRLCISSFFLYVYILENFLFVNTYCR